MLNSICSNRLFHSIFTDCIHDISDIDLPDIKPVQLPQTYLFIFNKQLAAENVLTQHQNLSKLSFHSQEYNLAFIHLSQVSTFYLISHQLSIFILFNYKDQGCGTGSVQDLFIKLRMNMRLVVLKWGNSCVQMIFGNIWRHFFGCPSMKWGGCCWHLVGRDQG